MAIVLNTTPEQEQQLAAEARAHGMAVEPYALAKILDQVNTTSSSANTLQPAMQSGNTLDDWQKALDEHLVWLTSATDEQTPAIALEEMTREQIYQERGERNG